MSAFFDYIQTFYVVPDAVNGSTETMITSINLFFKSKPSITKNISGNIAPGITVWLCDVVNNQPVPQKVIKKSITTINYEQINTSDNALSITTVQFNSGVILKSGKYYGIVIKYDDPAFEIWVNKQGDNLVSAAGLTNVISSGSQGRFEGILYKATNANDYLALTDRDLKFKVNVAKYIDTTGDFNLVNKAYEFLTVDSTSNSLQGGELVYQEVANVAGTISVSANTVEVIGSGTTFTNHNPGDYIVIANSSVRDILKIKNVANNTSLTLDSFPLISNTAIEYKTPVIGSVYYTDYTQGKIYLVDSTAANATFKFVTGSRIIGERTGASANVVSIDRYKLDNFVPKFLINNPSTSEFAITYSVANSSNIISSFSNLELLKSNNLNRESYILSRSQEVVEAGLYGASKRSAVVNVNFTVNVSNTNLFSAPYINTDELDFFAYQNDINNVYRETRYDIPDYDTEIEKNGLAKSKAIEKKVQFAADKFAEDIRVFITAYRPSGTEIRLYAKIHNSQDKETFDDKFWSPLELKDNIDKFSGSDKNDLIEYTYGLPDFPEVLTNLSGTFFTTLGSDTITTSIDQSSIVNVGDLIKLYDPIIAENHEEYRIQSLTSSTIVLNKPMSNVNLVGNMSVDKLKYKNVAWNNIANDSIARYINTAGVEFDTFNTMQIKIVYLSDNSYITPETEQIQVIGVSA